jgi:hypothetical protein
LGDAERGADVVGLGLGLGLVGVTVVVTAVVGPTVVTTGPG